MHLITICILHFMHFMLYYCRDKPSIKKLQRVLPTDSPLMPVRIACCCSSANHLCVYVCTWFMSDLSLTRQPPWAGQHCRFCLWHISLRHYLDGTVCVNYGFLQLQ